MPINWLILEIYDLSVKENFGTFNMIDFRLSLIDFDIDFGLILYESYINMIYS